MAQHSRPPLLTHKVDLKDLGPHYMPFTGQDESIIRVPHPEFDYVPDGWGAACWTVSQCGTSPALRDLYDTFFLRPCEPSDIVFECLTVLRQAPSGLSHTKYAQHSEDAQSENWTLVCQRYNARERSNEILGEFPYPLPGADEPVSRSPWRVRIRLLEPLSYPLPMEGSDPPDGLYQGPYCLLPAVPIFFASRFHHLRQLSRRLSDARLSRAPGHRDSDELEIATTRDIHSVLMSMLMFFVGCKGLEHQGERHGVKVFHYPTWKDIYEECEHRGSEVFGPKDGFGSNSMFLKWLKEGGDLEHWFRDASNWWVQGDETEDRRQKALLRDTFGGMVKSLEDVFHDEQLRHDYPHLVLAPTEFLPRSRRAHVHRQPSNSHSSQN